MIYELDIAKKWSEEEDSMKGKLKEVFKIDEDDKLNEAGWIPIDLEETEWMVVKMSLEKFNPPDQNIRKVVDKIKTKLKVLDSEHDIGQGKMFTKGLDKDVAAHNAQLGKDATYPGSDTAMFRLNQR